MNKIDSKCGWNEHLFTAHSFRRKNQLDKNMYERAFHHVELSNDFFSTEMK